MMIMDEHIGQNLVPLQIGGSRLPLFWIHCDQSNLYLAKYLGPAQPLYAFKHQGRHGERVRYTEVETIATHYLQQLRAIQTEGPYFLGGYSFGGTIAFEMAQQFRARGENVGLLFMIDSLYPGTHVENLSPAGTASFSVGVPRTAAYRQEIHRHLGNLSRLKPRDMMKYFTARVTSKLEGRMAPAITALKKILIRMYLTMDRPLPFWL